MSADEYDAVEEVKGRATSCMFVACFWLVGAIHVFALGWWLVLMPCHAGRVSGLGVLLLKGAGYPLIFVAILCFEQAVKGFRRTTRLNDEADRLEGQFGDEEVEDVPSVDLRSTPLAAAPGKEGANAPSAFGDQ